MVAPRFTVTHLSTTIFVDRLRLEVFEAFGRCHVAASTDGCANEQAMVTFDVANQDAAAFRRAVAAFNQVLDQHEGVIAKRNERRRLRRVTIAARKAA